MKGLLVIALVVLTTTFTTAVPQCAPGADGTLLGNPADCHSYYECVNGTPVLMQCPPGLEWSEAGKVCDFPNIAQCKETETEDPNTNPPTTAKPPQSTSPMPTVCPPKDDPNHDVLLPNPEDCGSFYKCFEGVPNLIQCPPGQHWSIELSRCDYPEVANCHETGSKPPTEATTSGPTTPRPTKCPSEDDPNHDVLLPNPDDCGSFFKCLGGVPHLIQCPPGQQWSIELNRCDLPEIAHCQISKKVALVFNLRKDDRCPDEDGEEDVLLPNPNDCTTFYKCNNGELVIQDCPEGLHWNDEGKYCDFPANAGCGKLMISAKNEWPTECPAENGVYDTFLPNLEDCTTYFKCDNGSKVLMECPVGTLWDAPMYRCDHAANARCA